ncbi:uncharacterized protein F4807DRAFT_223301 [Annulohypoxylon truncatum]|uniref:uncharacterized protein n=1 Tax=Annulohypoxylon truncatum TaxID=327061 RepID=UPI0020083C82|nr:uncharacterized protein F4807DRAFT_223301 [Annulohypoxylon truncatum]KAI1206521.1 hypothetical protein F4807DRAFT_223301 [Annulohypoxylon truncatum]
MTSTNVEHYKRKLRYLAFKPGGLQLHLVSMNRRFHGGHRWHVEERHRRMRAAEAGRQQAAAARPLRVIASPPQPVSDVAVAGLGLLDTLPNEVIMIVFENCTLRSLLRLERVNKAARKLVSLLDRIEYIRETTKGIIERAKPPYRQIMFTILKIKTYQGLHDLLTTFICEKCAKPGSFRIKKVKVLCDSCCSPVRPVDR